MKTIQVNKLDMYGSVITSCDKFKLKWSDHPGFVNAVTAMKNIIATINRLQQLQGADTTGATTGKDEAKDALITSALQISGAIVAYARATGNTALKVSMNFSATDLKTLRSATLIPVCQSIVEAARKISGPIDQDDKTSVTGPLDEYGISYARINGFEKAIAEYEAISRQTRAIINERVSATAELEKNFSEGDGLLDETLDKLMVQFINDSSGFYNDYQNARLIIDRGNGGNGLRGTVTDRLTGKVLEGVSILFVELDLSRVSDSNGHYIFRRIPPGSYTVRASFPGYTTGVFEKVVIGDLITNLDIRLSPGSIIHL